MLKAIKGIPSNNPRVKWAVIVTSISATIKIIIDSGIIQDLIAC